jgi:hypothetical protein
VENQADRGSPQPCVDADEWRNPELSACAWCIFLNFPLHWEKSLTEVSPELDYEWHQIRIVTAEMVHFIRQMQAYCQLEVIECSWKELLEFINKREGDLDALIEAHRSYLDRMVKKILLLSPKAGREVRILCKRACYAFELMLLL